MTTPPPALPGHILTVALQTKHTTGTFTVTLDEGEHLLYSDPTWSPPLPADFVGLEPDASETLAVRSVRGTDGATFLLSGDEWRALESGLEEGDYFLSLFSAEAPGTAPVRVSARSLTITLRSLDNRLGTWSVTLHPDDTWTQTPIWWEPTTPTLGIASAHLRRHADDHGFTLTGEQWSGLVGEGAREAFYRAFLLGDWDTCAVLVGEDLEPEEGAEGEMSADTLAILDALMEAGDAQALIVGEGLQTIGENGGEQADRDSLAASALEIARYAVGAHNDLTTEGTTFAVVNVSIHQPSLDALRGLVEAGERLLALDWDRTGAVPDHWRACQGLARAALHAYDTKERAS